MKNETRLAVGAIINLRERLLNNDAPRSVALAQRTFQRFRLPIEYLLDIVSSEKSDELEEIIRDLKGLQASAVVDKERFLEACDRLWEVLG